jgi:L-fucose isomerase-like protein
MEKIKISLLAHSGAPNDIFEDGEKAIQKALVNNNYEVVDKDPDVIFVLTGGSEKAASKLISNQKFVLIVSCSANNSYAAASEIKAFSNDKGINSLLINIDYDSLEIHLQILLKLKNALIKFENYNLGLIGNVSEWLIHSEIESEIIKQKLGITLNKVNWKNRDQVLDLPVNNEFVEYFTPSNNFNLDDSSKVYSLLNEIIETNKFDAITVECFPLVKEKEVTACLSLAKLIDAGLPAGCEGDLTSIVGMILAKEIFGIIPWMANLISVNTSEVLFAHCTIGTNLLKSYSINTHFESNIGTAIQGKLKAQDATIFRLDNKLENAFISYGLISEMPHRKDACRTQMKISLAENDINLLKNKPLGNHHLVIPGNYSKELEILCKALKIEVQI